MTWLASYELDAEDEDAQARSDRRLVGLDYQAKGSAWDEGNSESTGGSRTTSASWVLGVLLLLQSLAW